MDMSNCPHPPTSSCFLVTLHINPTVSRINEISSLWRARHILREAKAISDAIAGVVASEKT